MIQALHGLVYSTIMDVNISCSVVAACLCIFNFLTCTLISTGKWKDPNRYDLSVKADVAVNMSSARAQLVVFAGLSVAFRFLLVSFVGVVSVTVRINSQPFCFGYLS